MATQGKSMTTSEFAKATGIPAATISKLIQEGQLKAKKERNKWMVLSSQLESKIVREFRKSRKPSRPKKASKAAAVPRRIKALEPRASAPPPSKPPAAASAVPEFGPAGAKPEPVAAPRPVSQPEEKTYSITEFAAMTYLTEKGVCDWLRIGRLQGIQSEAGEWRVLESNLRVSDISRLVRK